MKKSLFQLIPFLMVYLLILFIGGIFVALYSKNVLHLIINNFHHPFFDFFFKYYTHIGDGLALVSLLPLLFFKKVRYVIIGTFSGILVAIITQFFKKVVFSDIERPSAVIDETHLHLIEGVKMAKFYSFPSGHSALVFALFLLLAYVYKENKKLQIIFCLLAGLGAFSRVYLSQHFVEDTLAGSLCGWISFILAVYFTNLFKKLPEKSLYELIFKKKQY